MSYMACSSSTWETSRASWRGGRPSTPDRSGSETTVRRKADALKLGKGAAFDKARLKRLRQDDETWEADFRALPRPMTQDETPLRGSGRHEAGRLRARR